MRVRATAGLVAGLAIAVQLAGFASSPVTANAAARHTRGAIRASAAVAKLVIAGPVTLAYTASTSDTDSCTGPCDESLAHDPPRS